MRVLVSSVVMLCLVSSVYMKELIRGALVGKEYSYPFGKGLESGRRPDIIRGAEAGLN